MATFSRRRFLVSSTAAALSLAGCGGGGDRRALLSTDPTVAARESARIPPGASVTRARLVAGTTELDLAGRTVQTWGFRGDTIRPRAGDILEVELRNELPESTTIHWHGIAIRNDMDGVHDLTQPAVGPGETFTYRFLVPHAGTNFFHPHTGLQLDRALYEPLVIDDPDDAGDYDADHTLVLDDWLDGTPEDAFASIRAGMDGMDMDGMDMGGMDMGGMAESDLLGGHAGDVAYRTHLINRRPLEDRPTFDAPAGGRTRLRLINAASDTAYRVAIGGHRLTVTHADGFPVQPVEVDAILIGMGERYDVSVTALPGSHPIVAIAEGKDQAAVGVLRTGTGEPPPVDARPAELDGRILTYDDLRPVDAVRLASTKPDVTHELDLTGSETAYVWGINDRTMADLDPFEVEEGQVVRLTFRNRSTMWHPMHLHGHTFAADGSGVRKDTIIVKPSESVSVSFAADNPGQWMVHCHNTYHLEAGMAGVISYVS